MSELREILKFFGEMGAEFLHLPGSDPRADLAELEREILQCRRCRLHESKTHYVPGEGCNHPDILFVGEGPGETEDQFGRPFIGKAGQLLDKIIQKMDLERADVFITNVVKCRPPNNREPQRDEVEACLPYLARQIDVLQPKVIVCLGRVALNNLLGTSHSMGRIRGQLLSFHDIPLIPTYHPSYILHKKDKEEISQAKWEVWEDMQKVLALIPQETPLKISVALSYNISEPLTYRVEGAPAGLQAGSRVLVPLGRRLALGWVLSLDSPYGGRLKSIIGVIDDPFRPQPAVLEFARLAAAAYFVSAGSVLDHCLPPSQKTLKKLRLETGGQARKMEEFTAGQLEKLSAAGPLRFFFKTGSDAGPVAAVPPPLGGAAPVRLLLGPGREAEYAEMCRETLAGGRSVILLVPDNATAGYWQGIIPGLDPYHSEVKAAAKESVWRQYRQGKSGVVCGGLSALLLPLADPGLLIVDRAASPLYQRGFASPFHIDHLAAIRAQTGHIPLQLGAASHSCATYRQRQDLAITDRRRERGVSCQVHMLKGRERGIPDDLLDMIRRNYLEDKKTLVLVNRIQPALHLFCDQCRKIVACPGCGGTLQVEEPRQAACRRCTYRKQALDDCPRCGRALAMLRDISIESLSLAVERAIGEKAARIMTAADLKDAAATVAAVRSSPIVIATAAALNPFFSATFAAVIYVKPESFFNMEEFNAAEMIFATAAEIAETLKDEGELHVFSVFHFHYALQFLMDEEKFFERELKYRQWFSLPPFASVYQLELRDASLRALAAAMRGLNRDHRQNLQIKRIYLVSRQPQRGTFRGILELHAAAEKIARAGLHKIKRSTLLRIAG